LELSPLGVVIVCHIYIYVFQPFCFTELKELIALHATTQAKGGDLQTDAVTILQGALDLQEKTVTHAMTDIRDTFMLSIDTILDRKTLSKILRSGHSRIPVFDGPADQPLNDRNIIGVLLVKVIADAMTICHQYAVYLIASSVPYHVGSR
jgi:CBS domain containing-hemolysin-like protein